MKIRTQNKTGFTLTELMVVVAISSILAVIAVNLFSTQARQGRRADGINSILAISLAEERYRSSNTTYGTLAQVWNNVSASAEGYYTLSISNTSASAYTITAAAVGNQANDSVNGTSCASLVLSVSNGTVTKTPAVCWPS